MSNILYKDREIITKGFDLFLFFSYCSVDLQEVCEEGQTDADKMHIPVVSPTGVQCKGCTTLVLYDL